MVIPLVPAKTNVELLAVSIPGTESTDPLPVSVHVTVPASSVCAVATVIVPVTEIDPLPTFVVVFVVPSPSVRLLNVHELAPPKLPPF